jgi:hypothetical protein
VDAVKLEKLIIGEVSGVDDPANQIPGWMVQKSAGLLALGILVETPAAPETGFKAVWGEDGTLAFSHEDAPTITVVKNGVSTSIDKSSIDSKRAAEAVADGVPPPSSVAADPPPRFSLAQKRQANVAEAARSFRRPVASPALGGQYFA